MSGTDPRTAAGPTDTEPTDTELTSTELTSTELIDTDRYPLGDAALVAHVREQLRGTGCCALPDFVRPVTRETLGRETAQVAELAYYDVQTVNVYNTEPDPSLPVEHPARVPLRRSNAFVARDLIPADAVVSRLYADPEFQAFVAACFDLPRVHELADPLSGLTINVLPPGGGHPWHFDTNELTVSMLTRVAEDGGIFEYCPRLRSPHAENVEDVHAVLDGHGEHLIRRLAPRPGDLQLFLGRYSLHRVTTVRGTSARHCAIFAYSARPGVVGTAARTRQLFGRVTPAHLNVGGRTVRVDELID